MVDYTEFHETLNALINEDAGDTPPTYSDGGGPIQTYDTGGVDYKNSIIQGKGPTGVRQVPRMSIVPVSDNTSPGGEGERDIVTGPQGATIYTVSTVLKATEEKKNSGWGKVLIVGGLVAAVLSAVGGGNKRS